MLARPVSLHALPGLLALSAVLLGGADVAAQSGEPIGWFVADLRGSIAPFGQNQTLAIDRGFDPTVTPGTGLGLEAGAHIYVFRWRVITFGVGASFHTSVADRRPTDTDPDPNGPILRKKFTAITPQISLNFGGRNGWSYLSGGLGTSQLSLFARNDEEPDQRRSTTVNYGGGARWFLSEHLAFSLDLRFYDVSPLEPTDTEPGAPRMTVMVFSVGASFK